MALGIGVIGAGVMGSDHAKTLAASVRGAEVVAISDADETRAAAAAGAAGGARTYDDARALIASPDVQAVLVASPDDTHVPYSLACIAAAKPVLCEKPLSPDAEGSLAVIRAETELGRRLVQVGFMRRFDPGYAAMKAESRAGHLGRPIMLHNQHRNAEAPPWFTADMVITNSGVHEIDISRWLLDDDFVSATAFFKAQGGKAPFDRQFLVLESARGTIVDIEVYLSAAYGYDVAAELVCETGTVALASHAPVETRHGLKQGRAYAPDWRGHFAEAYRRQLQAWVDAAAAGEAAGASAWDGYVATATAAACVEAVHASGPVPIRLAERPGLYR